MSAELEERRRRQEEVEALEAIYGGDAVARAPDGGGVEVAVAAAPHALRARFHLPAGYPSGPDPPAFELLGDALPPSDAAALAAELLADFTPGEEVLFRWCEHLRARWADICEARLEAQREREQELVEKNEEPVLEPQPLEPEGAVAAARIVHGEPFTVQKSTFQAHVARVTSAADVAAVMDALLQNKKVQAATHNMMAYRIEGANGALLQDCDDDGEQAAGGRLLHLLQLVGAVNVVVVVSRWRLGGLLGPQRFSIISNCARELLGAQGFVGAPRADAKARKKKK